MKLVGKNLLSIAIHGRAANDSTVGPALLPRVRRKLLALSTMVVLTGGGLLLAAPPVSADEAMPPCEDWQVEEVKERIRKKCGIWGGKAWARCSGEDGNWNVNVLKIHCWEDGIFYDPPTQ